MRLGSDFDGSLTAIDCLAIISLIISLENLEENLSQNDKQDIQNDLSEKADKILQEIHNHLEMQDNKIDEILKRLEMIK